MSHPSVEAVTIAILPSNFRGFELIFNFAVVKKKRLVSTPALFSIITITSVKYSSDRPTSVRSPFNRAVNFKWEELMTAFDSMSQSRVSL